MRVAFFVLYFLAVAIFGAPALLMLLLTIALQLLHGRYQVAALEREVVDFLRDGRRHETEVLDLLRNFTRDDEKSRRFLGYLVSAGKIRRWADESAEVWYMLTHNPEDYPGGGKRTRFRFRIWRKPSVAPSPP